MTNAQTLHVPDELRAISRSIHQAGGRAVLVGGSVRDHLLGLPPKDLDVEVFGLVPESLEAQLAALGEVITVGRAFGVFRVKGLDIDFSLPRKDSKTEPGHRGFSIAYDPEMSFSDASRRRDLTINSMGIELTSGELLDPHGGQADLEARRLRATDPVHFPEDPLRALRVAEFAARFEMEPTQELVALCATLDLAELSPERVFSQFCKLLLKAKRPSIGFRFLRDANLVRFFPELEALIDTPQEPEWHPEGDVWVHTLMVIDEAALLRRGDEEDLPLMWGALCHDVGKPPTTQRIDGRVRSHQHDTEGVEISRAMLERFRAPTELTEQVMALVRYHLAPAIYRKSGASDKAYRRLARNLRKASVTMELLLRVANADHFGRTTEDALARRYPSGDHFRAKMEKLSIETEAPTDVVLGRHLISRGLKPGPRFGQILETCRELQYETGWTDPEVILDAALSPDGSTPQPR